MNEALRGAAQSGSIDALYALIQDDADVFRCIDQTEFVDTPLHIAAAAGHTDFAMEMMNLKPSFARKLNRGGFSPIHLALQNDQIEMVLDLLSIDKDLVRVKGRDGYTPLHFAARDGYVGLLSQFLDYCPNCILDLTIQKETVLHIAAQNNRLEALKVILKWIQRNAEDNQIHKDRILNLQDKEGNTILHIAAANNQPPMIKLLIQCKAVDRNKINYRGLTALNVLQRQTQVDCRESLNILYRAGDPPTMFLRLSVFTKLERDIKEMKADTINALLVVFTLILSMTYQALLSPPGGVSQGDPGSNRADSGKSVIRLDDFLLFHISNLAAFVIAWVMIIYLLKAVARNIASFVVFQVFGVMFFSYGVALSIIAPTRFASWGAFVGASIMLVFIYFLYLFFFKRLARMAPKF